MHDDVAGLQLQRIDDVAPTRRELLHDAAVGADRAAVELRFGEHGELRLGQLEAALELPEHGDGDPGLGRLVEAVGGAGGDAAVGEHVPRTIDEAGARRCHDHAPALRHESSDVRGRTVDVALERRHRPGRHADDVALAETLVGGIRLAGVEPAERPPHAAALAGRGLQLGQGEEVAGVEVDGRVGARGRGAPRRLEELAVRLAERHGAGDGPLGIDERHSSAARQVVDERHERIGDRGQQRLHALDRDALAHLLEHRAEAREPAVEARRALPHRGRQQQFARRQQRDGGHVAGERPLVGDRERADLIDLVAEELDPVRVVGDGREDIEDASAHRELAAPRDHVDPEVGEPDEATGDRFEVVAAAGHGELERTRLGETRRDGLQGPAHRGGDDERRVTGIRPLGRFAEHGEATADGLGRGAQPFVGQGLPRGEMADGRVRHEALQRGADAVGAAAGGRDDEEGCRGSLRIARAAPGGAAGGEQRSEHRGVEARDHREIGVGAGGLGGALHGRSLRQGARDPGNCHRTSLLRPTDTGSAAAGGAPATGRRRRRSGIRGTP